jgi:hypothetical protein
MGDEISSWNLVCVDCLIHCNIIPHTVVFIDGPNHHIMFNVNTTGMTHLKIDRGKSRFHKKACPDVTMCHM